MEAISPYIIPGIKMMLMPPPMERHKVMHLSHDADYVVDKVLMYFKKRKENVFRRTRKSDIVYCRHMIYYFLRSHTMLSLKDIGSIIFNRFPQDHTTVINAVKKINNLADTEEMVRQDIQNIKYLL